MATFEPIIKPKKRVQKNIKRRKSRNKLDQDKGNKSLDRNHLMTMIAEETDHGAEDDSEQLMAENQDLKK